MAIFYLCARNTWQSIVFINKHRFPFAATYNFNFIVNIIIMISYMNIVHKVNSCLMNSLLFITVPANGIANFESRRCFHLFVEYTVPVPFKKLRINVILFWCDEHGILDRSEICCVVIFAYIRFKTCRKKDLFAI